MKASSHGCSPSSKCHWTIMTFAVNWYCSSKWFSIFHIEYLTSSFIWEATNTFQFGSYRFHLTCKWIVICFFCCSFGALSVRCRKLCIRSRISLTANDKRHGFLLEGAVWIVCWQRPCEMEYLWQNTDLMGSEYGRIIFEKLFTSQRLG